MMTNTQLESSKTPVLRRAPSSDFYHVTEYLTEVEGDVLKRVRSLMETKVAAVITDFRPRDSFPIELVPGIITGLDFEQGVLSPNPSGWMARLFKRGDSLPIGQTWQWRSEKLDRRETTCN
jgi:hypothetical protein